MSPGCNRLVEREGCAELAGVHERWVAGTRGAIQGYGFEML